jgi:hypothetical protein
MTEEFDVGKEIVAADARLAINNSNLEMPLDGVSPRDGS